MDFMAKWDANFSNYQKRQLQLIEFIEKFSIPGSALCDAKKFQDEFSSCGSLLVVRLLSAIKRSFNCAQSVDLHLRALLICFQSADWELYLGGADAVNCMHVLLTVASVNPSEAFDDVHQALLVSRRMLQRPQGVSLFVELGGVVVVTGAVQASLDTGLHRTCISVLFECAAHSDPTPVLEAVKELFNSPRGTSKYSALSLCRRLLTDGARRAHVTAAGSQWLEDVLPQVVRLLVNRPIFYQYECASFIHELLAVPGLAAPLCEQLNALVVLRCVVGGTSVIDNESWAFVDCAAPRRAAGAGGKEGSKKPSKWGKIASSVKTSSRIEDAMRDALVVVHASKNKPMAGSMSQGGQALQDVEIAQDPTVIVARAVATLLDICEISLTELVTQFPHRFGEYLSDMTDNCKGGAPLFDATALVSRNHVSVLRSRYDALNGLTEGRHHIVMMFNLLSTVHQLLERWEDGLLRKLVLLAGRPPARHHVAGEHHGSDLTEAYSTHPLQFTTGASRSGMSLEKFYHDGVAVTFLMLLYTLQRWVNLDCLAKSEIIDLLTEFDLMKVNYYFDRDLDHESLCDDSSGDESSEQQNNARDRSAGDEGHLDLYMFFVVVLRISRGGAILDGDSTCASGTSEVVYRNESADLVARQHRTVDASNPLDPAEHIPTWSAQQQLERAVDELRRRIGGGGLVAQLKTTLFEGVGADTTDRYAPLSKAELVHRKSGVSQERKARSPYSPRRRMRRHSPDKTSIAPETLKVTQSLCPVGLQDVDPATVNSVEEVFPKNHSEDLIGQKASLNFQELLSAAIHGANVSDFKNKNGPMDSKVKRIFNEKNELICKTDSVQRPRERSESSDGNSRRRSSSGESRVHIGSVSQKLQNDLRVRIDRIRNPKSPTRMATEPGALGEPDRRSSFRKSSLRSSYGTEKRVDEMNPQRTTAVRFEGGSDGGSKQWQQHVYLPTPPASARSSLSTPADRTLDLTVPQSQSPRNRQHTKVGRSYRARDSPRARQKYKGALSQADDTALGTEMMHNLQAMFFGGGFENEDDV